MKYSDIDAETAKLSPSSALDEVWHLLMLRPRLYASVCRSLGVAELIDHDPRLALEGHSTRLKATIKAYKRAFGVRPPFVWREKDEVADDCTECSSASAPPAKRVRRIEGGAATAAADDGCGPPPAQYTMDDYTILKESNIHLALRLRGC